MCQTSLIIRNYLLSLSLLRYNKKKTKEQRTQCILSLCCFRGWPFYIALIRFHNSKLYILFSLTYNVVFLSYFTVVRAINRHEDNEDDKSRMTHLIVNAFIQRLLIGSEQNIGQIWESLSLSAYYLFKYQCILTSGSAEKKNNNDDRLKNAPSSQFYECKWFHLRLGCVCVYTLNSRVIGTLILVWYFNCSFKTIKSFVVVVVVGVFIFILVYARASAHSFWNLCASITSIAAAASASVAITKCPNHTKL